MKSLQLPRYAEVRISIFKINQKLMERLALRNTASPERKTDIEDVLGLLLQLRDYGHIQVEKYAKLEPQSMAIMEQPSKQLAALVLIAK